MKTILLGDSDREHAEAVADLLQNEGYIASIVSDRESCLDRLESGDFDLLVTDLFGNESDGVRQLVEVVGRYPHLQIIGMTLGDDVISEFHAFLQQAIGASHVLRKPLDRSKLMPFVQNALLRQRLRSPAWNAANDDQPAVA